MSHSTPFEAESAERVARIGADSEIKEMTAGFLRRSIELQYSYNYFWMGRPIIQYPQDIVAMQEIVGSVERVSGITGESSAAGPQAVDRMAWA